MHHFCYPVTPECGDHFSREDVIICFYPFLFIIIIDCCALSYRTRAPDKSPKENPNPYPVQKGEKAGGEQRTATIVNSNMERNN
jgi:hypothetical protein